MDKKKNPWLPYLIVLGVLIALLIYTQWKESGYEIKIRRIVNVKDDVITSITISKNNSAVTLEKADTLWVFQAPDTGAVSVYRIKEFFKEVVNGEYENAITSDTALYDKYGVTADKATKVVLRKQDEVIANFYVGRSVTDFQLEYIRFENDPRVYPARQKMLNKMGTTAGWWR